MRFTETELAGAYLIELEPKADRRGFFARAWCQDELAALGLNTQVVQCNIGHSAFAGTLRGIHNQRAPHEEAKVVRCVRGAVYDVIVDLRLESPTFRQWSAVELTAESRKMLYIPQGIGHGYQTLTDETEIFYQTSEFYHPESSTGVRFDDPAFGIQWPLPPSSLSDADKTWPLYDSLLLTTNSTNEN